MDTQKPSSEMEDLQKKCKNLPVHKKDREIGGYEDHGLKEPTRYGDWEVKGRCTDF